mgnify:CR=1 FL=1
MAKSSVLDAETAVENAQKGLEIALEAQVKAEETEEAALSDLFDAAASTLRQARSASSAMPMLAPMFELQERTLENARTMSKTSFDNYRKNVAEPMRKLARESAARLPKGR